MNKQYLQALVDETVRQNIFEQRLTQVSPVFTPDFIQLLAVSAGELHGQLLRKGMRERETMAADGSQKVQRNLKELQERQLLTERDLERLSLLFGHVEGDAELSMVPFRVRVLYEELVDDKDSSPLALALASIVIDSTLRASTPEEIAAKQGIVVPQERKNIAKADAGGALEGAIAGAIVGEKTKTWQAALGCALIGAIAGAAISSLAEHYG